MLKAKQPIPEIEPISFLNRARHFYMASERVFEPQDQLLNMPLYFLYFHILDLTFKAFLRSCNVSTQELKDRIGHSLVALYGGCRSCGFRIGPNDQVDIENVVNLLEGANEEQGLRYFNSTLKGLPSLSWTCEVIQKAIRNVESRLEATGQATPLPASKLVFIWDVPRAAPKV